MAQLANERPSLLSSENYAIPGQLPQEEPLSPETSHELTLTQAVYARREEYTRSRTVRIKVGTWNVAAFKGTSKDLGEWFVEGKGIAESLSGMSISSQTPLEHTQTEARKSEHTESFGQQEARHTKKRSTLPKGDEGTVPGGKEVGIYALGLQEIVDINSAVEAFKPYSDVTASNHYKKALQEALPDGYQLVAEQQLIGLYLMVFAAPALATHIHSVSTTSVGTGLMGYMGNKGAVTARIVLGETTSLVFINSHMSAGVGKTELERRNWDAAQILSRTKFDPITDSLGVVDQQGERIADADFAFWFGDLNYRIADIPGDDVRKILMRHTGNEYDVGQRSQRKIDKELHSSSPSNSSSNTSAGTNGENSNDDDLSVDTIDEMSTTASSNDPVSLQSTLNSLLVHDELRQQQKTGNAFQDGWREGDIAFLPTYKYDVGTVGLFDSGDKRRGPSWCDRIIYRTKKDRIAFEEKARMEREAKVRDTQMRASGVESAAEDENTMFEYDPDADGDFDYEEGSIPSSPPSTIMARDEGPENITLEHYMSHQRVLSSDHKPVDCVFALTYDAVDPDEKSKIQQEVARDFDKAENEGRPVVTIVVDEASNHNDPSFHGVHFGQVRFDDVKTRSVTVANTGRVRAELGFVNSSSGVEDTGPKHVIPEWLSILVDRPSDQASRSRSNSKSNKKDGDAWSQGLSDIFSLEPGDTTDIQMTCHVQTQNLVQIFNDKELLEDILVLRVKDGRDHFLPVRGNWQQSSYGRTIDRLIRIPEGGIRALQGQIPEGSKRDSSEEDSKNDTNKDKPVMWSAPREILRLTGEIEKMIERIIAEWEMLGTEPEGSSRAPWVKFAGWPFVDESWELDQDARRQLRVEINEALDVDKSFEDFLSPDVPILHRVEAFAESLLNFLSMLEDGIIPIILSMKLEKEYFSSKNRSKQSSEDKRTKVLEILASSPSHKVSFFMLMSTLTRISSEIVGAIQSDAILPRSSTDLPTSPKAVVKRKSLNKDPSLATQELINKNFANVFSSLIAKAPISAKSKDMSLTETMELVELFLDTG